MHGAMCFYRDDGSAVVYEFSGGDDFIDPEGDISSIQDAFEYFTKVVKGDDSMESSNEEGVQDLQFVQLRSLPKADVDTIRRRKFQRALEPEFHDGKKKLIINFETLKNIFKYEFTHEYDKGHKNYENVKTVDNFTSNMDLVVELHKPQVICRDGALWKQVQEQKQVQMQEQEQEQEQVQDQQEEEQEEEEE